MTDQQFLIHSQVTPPDFSKMKPDTVLKLADFMKVTNTLDKR